MFPAPSRISRYEIKTLIGAGGMGSLYLARDTNPNTNRLVALKLLLANLDSGDLRERFAREARALAALNHPNIVDIYDSGEFQGSPYIVMEYVRGETLAEKIKRRAPMSLAQKLKLMVELCSGLGHAHEAGIIHRDIKPANLMVDQHGRLKILDFGIARVSEGLTQAGLQMTQLHMRIGTPGYMSPEQIEGVEIDRRTDLFAVGSVCYELLAYREAFTGVNTRQIENQVLQAQPIRLTSLIDGLDPGIERIVCRALEKDRDQRYQEASELEDALERMRWQLGPSETPIPTSRPTPVPAPAVAKRSHDGKADAAYQRSLQVYDEGATEAARRFAIEALAEDPQHEGAREFLERLEPNRWRTIVPASALAATTAPTALGTESFRAGLATEAPTVLSTSTHPPGAAPSSGGSRATGGRFGKGAQIAAIVAGVAVIIAGAVLAGLWLWPSGQVLTITRPVGGTISGNGVNCGTVASSCTTTIARNSTVELRAEPDSGFIFGGFTGDCVNGRTIMSAARTCSATFNAVAEAPKELMRELTVVKPEHGTIVGPGIQCGSFGADCTTQHPEGREITLKAYADENYTFRGFTGDCLKNGETVMKGARRCAATFVQDRVASNVAPPRDAAPPVRSSTPRTSSPTAQSTPDPLDGRRTSADPPMPSVPEIDRDGKPSAGAPPPARATPESIAKDDIKKLLDEYRAAWERLDAEGIKRLYPGASVPGLRRAFGQYKSLEYTYTGAPEFIDVDPALGTATVKVGAKLSPVYKGPKEPPQTLTNLFKLVRHDGTWTIRELTYPPK
jgi:Protein kinase domain/Divergent InlB B-repeat domain